MRNIRTDLAQQTYSFLLETADSVPGIASEEETGQHISITRVKITTDSAAEKIGKPKGNYITLFLPDIRYADKSVYEEMYDSIAKELRLLLPQGRRDKPILIIGLGNRGITSDSLGPAVLDRLMITRHLFSYAPDALSSGMHSVCAIAPGVLGITGIETEEIISALCKKIDPYAVICIDALAARGIDRITATVQICDTGIHPGAGVGNNRKEISKSTLGVPVIAIGVPTVVDAATITDDTLDIVIKNLKNSVDPNSSFFQMLQNLDDDAKHELIHTAVSNSLPHFMTTPKDIDILIAKSAEIVANGINFALHDGITMEDIQMYVS